MSDTVKNVKSKNKKTKKIPKIKNIPSTNNNTEDLYTKNVLDKQYTIHKDYVLSRIESAKNLNVSFRLPAIPEDISENIVKFILHKNGDTSSKWNCKKGDLLGNEGVQECKCFTSDGPLSFTPSSDWDCIYFLDATKWLENNTFKLYKYPFKKSSDEWKNIKVNKTQTFENQCSQGRRPRITRDALYPQIKEKCILIDTCTITDIVS